MDRQQDKASDKGLIAELSFELEAFKRGFVLSKPVHPKSVYDYILDIEGKLKRIQVKFTSCRNPQGNFRLTCAKGSTSKYKKRQQYYSHDCDYIVGLTSDNDWYIIPMSEAPTTCITLNNSWDTYKNNWEFK